MKLTILTYNTRFAGRDGSDARRVQAHNGMRDFLTEVAR